MSVDRTLFEILRHRLWQITDEMAITLKRVSGSPSVTQVNDFMVALYTPDGEILSGGWGVQWHITSAAAACKHIVKKFSGKIEEGDTFLLNDPYIAAIHQSDVYMVSPIHYEGKLAAWCANFVHVTDIGAIDPGGFSPRATSVFHEGLRFKGIKLVEGGNLREDLFESIVGMTREPGMVALDLRSQIAANNVARVRTQQLYARYGEKTVLTTMKSLIRHTEDAVRSRLKELPDGIWRTIQPIDISGDLYEVKLAMKKKDTSLIFDFDGTSKQSPRGLNCTYWGALGGVMGAVFSLLCFDLPINEGCIKPVQVLAPQGSIVNCDYPAPVSISTVGATVSAANAAMATISKMLDASGKYSDELMAVGDACSAVVRHAGLNQEGRYYVSGLWDWLAGCCGARSYADGVDNSGGQAGIQTMMQATNIENTEATFPLLYLFRRQSIDSGGAGRYRGGASGECCITLHDAPSKKIDLIVSGWGVEVDASTGIAGGYAGAPAYFALIEGNVMNKYLKSKNIPAKIEKLSKGLQTLPPQWTGELMADRCFFLRWAGGGGYGDPLNREPERIINDVKTGLVSREMARDLYGVTFKKSDRGYDPVQTENLRKQLRKTRQQKGKKIRA